MSQLLGSDFGRIRAVMVPTLIVGLGVLVAYAYGISSGWRSFFDVLAVACTALAASMVAGALIGLLFGIPRTLVAGSGSEDRPGESSRHRRYGGNSNLEQVSDWLTKILIGASIAEARAIAAGVGEVGWYFSQAAGNTKGQPVFSGMLVFGAVCGFFLSYLLTRIALPSMLEKAEQDPEAEVLRVLTLRRRGEERVAPAVLPEAAERIANIPIADVSADTLAKWGRAQLLKGDYGLAARALSEAAEQNQGDSALAEDLLFSLLYLKPPEGFLRAIEMAKRLPMTTGSARVYEACAYGQAYKWELAHGAQRKELTKLRDAAYEAARKALDLDPGQRPLLASLIEAEPSDPDDDLMPFRADATFRALVGLSGAASDAQQPAGAGAAPPPSQPPQPGLAPPGGSSQAGAPGA